MARRAALIVAVAGLMGLAPAPSAGAATGDPLARASLMGTRCGFVSLGFTSARVYGINVSCVYARSVFRSWLARPRPPSGPPPTISYVRGFRCRFGGTDFLVKLDCYRGTQIVRGRWGG